MPTMRLSNHKGKKGPKSVIEMSVWVGKCVLQGDAAIPFLRQSSHKDDIVLIHLKMAAQQRIG